MSRLELAIFLVLLAGFASVNFVYIVLMVLALPDNRRRAHQVATTSFPLLESSLVTIPVTVVIASYNEGPTLVDGIHSVLNSEFPEFEVIVVDDGSTDGTVDILKEEFDLVVRDVFGPRPLPTGTVRRTYQSSRLPHLWVVEKENGGKADAINAGANLARYRYILIADADCRFHPEALLRMVRVVNFDPEHVVGIGGHLRIGNGLVVRDGQIVDAMPRSLFARFQMLEYLSSFLYNRLGWGRLNGIPVMSGAFNAWRRDVFLQLGGFSTTTTHEDIEFTLRVHEAFRRTKVPYRIVVLPDPVIWTDVPETFRGLFLQRKRWQRVVYEVLWRYRVMLFNPRYGTVGLLTLPNLLYFEALGPFVEVFSYLFLLFLYFRGDLSVPLFAAFLALSFGLSAITRQAALVIDGILFRTYSIRMLLGLSLIALLERIVFRPVTVIARLAAFPEFLAGRTTREEVSPARSRRFYEPTPSESA